jgi:hypothetical protein
MAPTNYNAPLYWYRKVERHPDPAMDSLAKAFCEHVGQWLEMDSPKIYWFEEADFHQASQTWLKNSSKNNKAADPLREPCEYFRWSGPPRTLFWGYTHRDAPLGIMINVCRQGKDLLDTVAHECFHIHQDVKHGAGWRAKSSAAAEQQVNEFLHSRAGEIGAFLKHWELSREHQLATKDNLDCLSL